MKVLFIVNGYPTANSPNLCPFIQSQANDLRKLGITVNVVSASWYKSFGYIRTLFRSIFLVKTHDVIHFHHGLMLLLCFPFCFLFPRKKYLVSFLNNIEFEFEELNSKSLQRILILFVKTIIWVTGLTVIEKNGRHVRHFKNYLVLPNGVDLGFYKSQNKYESRLMLGLAQNDFVFLFVSSKTLLRNQKRIDRFKDLVALNPKIFPLYMSGVDKIDTLTYYSAADFLIVTSDLEGSPNAVKEALACGTPVLSLDVGDVSNIIAGEPNSKIFHSFEAMKNYIKQIDAISYKGQLFDGHQVIRKNGYDSNEIAAKLIEVYKN